VLRSAAITCVLRTTAVIHVLRHRRQRVLRHAMRSLLWSTLRGVLRGRLFLDGARNSRA
jgi:hypothetical protein